MWNIGDIVQYSGPKLKTCQGMIVRINYSNGGLLPSSSIHVLEEETFDLHKIVEEDIGFAIQYSPGPGVEEHLIERSPKPSDEIESCSCHCCGLPEIDCNCHAGPFCSYCNKCPVCCQCNYDNRGRHISM